MAEITRQRQGEILQKVFEILSEAPDGLPAKAVLQELERRMELTPFEDAPYPNRPDVRRFPKIVRFTTINPVKAGWMVKERGMWSLTDEGLTAYRRYSDPYELMVEAVRLYREWRKEQAPEGEAPLDEAEEAVPEEAPLFSAALEEAEENAFSEIETYLYDDLDPFQFQDVVAALLRAMDYHVLWIAPPGRDAGLDLLAQRDPLGTEGPRIKGQIKRRRDKATADDLRSFISLLGTHDVGVFVSFGGFTRDAELLAHTQETRRLTLINLPTLLDLWVEHYGAIDEADRQLLPLKPIHYLAPRES